MAADLCKLSMWGQILQLLWLLARLKLSTINRHLEG